MRFCLAAFFAGLCFLPMTSHGQSSLRHSLSVQPVPGLNFDTWVESITRDGSRASVVAELAALVSGGKAQPGEAVLLSMLLEESGRDEEALTVLRQNAQRHPADRMSLSALARGCAEGGYFDDEESALTQLYHLPAPPAQRLECLRQLAMARQFHGRLRELRDALVKQQTEHPENAYGWMELAVVQARAGEDEESRRCVYEASKLRPQDAALLGEIAQHEAGYGFLTEALSTLDAADKVAKPDSTQLLRSLLQLRNAEEPKPPAALKNFTLPADADVELVLDTADALAQGHAWSAAVRLLDQALVAHATNYQLHYLRAVALEEMGAREAAVTAFISMLTLSTELPADESHWFGRRYRSSDHNDNSLEGLALPSGTRGLMHSQEARQGAYSYRRGDSGICICYAYTQVEDAPRGRFITLPPTLLSARHRAGAHLQSLLPCVAAGRRAEAEKAAAAGGLEHAELLLDAGAMQTPGTLPRHPHDLALRAARLLSPESGDKKSLEMLDAEVALFREGYPQLAFIAACRAYRAAADLEAGVPAPATQPDSAAARRMVALSLADQTPACPMVAGWLLSLLPHRYGPGYGHAAEPATAEELRILSRAVDLALQLPEMRRDTRANTMAPIVQAALVNDDLRDAIRLVRGIAQTSAPAATAPPGLTLGEPVGAPLPQPLAELGLTKPLLAAVAARVGGSDVARLYPEPRLSQARALLAQVPEADARRTLELCLGDDAEIEAETKLRMAKPQPTAADHLLAARFLPSPQKGLNNYLQHLGAAIALTQDATQLRIMDQAVLFMVSRSVISRSQEKLSEAEKTLVLASIRRLQAVELHPAFTEAVQHAWRNFGSVAEIEQASQREEQERQAGYAKAETMPYSRAAANKLAQARYHEMTQLLAAALKARDLPAIAALGRVWLEPHLRQNTFSFSMQQMLGQLGGPEAFKLLMHTCKPDAASGEVAQMSYAESLTEIGDAAAALQIYTEMAERDPLACQPRLYAAFLQVEDAPDKALEFLRSIRLPAVLPAENGASPVDKLASERKPAAHRAAVARLVTRWINSVKNPADLDTLLVCQTCTSLIHMIQCGETDGEGDTRFPDLNRAKESDDCFIPKSPGAVAMKEARQAHDDLCRALRRLPEAQPTALAALASLIMKDGGDLSECARMAADMLRDPQARLPLREWVTAPGAGGELFAGPDSIAVPSPMTILVRHAAQTNDFTPFERVGLPLIEQALGSSAAASARLYARLFNAPESEYPAAAAAWLETHSSSENPNVRSFNEVLNVWQQRALRVDLTDLLLKSDAARYQLELGNVPKTLTRYVTSLAKAGHREEALAVTQALRDLLTSSDADERRRLITAWQVQQGRYRSVGYEAYRRLPVSEEKPSFVDRFESWLKFSLRDPTLVFLLPLAFEEGLFGSPGEIYELSHEMMKPELLSSPEACIALADQLGFLADAPAWHDYVISTDSDLHTWISRMAYSVRHAQDTGAMRKMLAARQPQTLGCEIFAALLVHNKTNVYEFRSGNPHEKRDELLRDVLTRRQAELAAIAPAQRRTFSLLLRTELPGYPDVSKLDAGLAAALQPFLDAEADDLLPVLDRVLAAKEWSEVGMSVREFTERFPTTLAQVARRHPAQVEQVVRHGIELLHQTPEDDEAQFFGHSGNSPIARFIWHLGQVPQLLGTCMSLAESEKLMLDPSWPNSFAHKLTDDDLIHHRDHLAAIFTQSPLLADAAHFKDFVLPSRSDYEAVTLLDKIVTALNNDDANAQWLHQRLKAAPEPTFGIQLTLALLDCNAAVRKARGNSNTARRDPAPLNAFSTAHAEEISQLSPAAAKAMETLLERYRKPPAQLPNPASGQPAPEPFRAPPNSLR